MINITIKYTSLFLLALAVGLATTDSSYAQDVTNMTDGSAAVTVTNSPPVGPDTPIVSIVFGGEPSEIVFSGITDDVDAFEDLIIQFVRTPATNEFVFNNLIRESGFDRASNQLTAEDGIIRYELSGGGVDPVTFTQLYTITDTEGGMAMYIDPLTNAATTMHPLFINFLPTRFTGEITGQSVTYTLNNTDSEAFSVDIDDYLRDAYPLQQRIDDNRISDNDPGVSIARNDFDDMVLTTINGTDLATADGVILANVNGTVSIESGQLTLSNLASSNVTITLYLNATLDNIAHNNRTSGSSLSIIFDIIDTVVESVCTIDLDEGINFGALAVGSTSNGTSTIALTNTGNQAISSTLGAANWLSQADNAIIMNAGQTHWSTDAFENLDRLAAYDARTAFVLDEIADTGAIIVDGTRDIYLQLQAILVSDSTSFRGIATQTLTVSSTCAV